MPHQCTSCGHVFADGSKEMLSGCPDCGGNKFQFRPAGTVDESAAGETSDSVGTETSNPTGPTSTDRTSDSLESPTTSDPSESPETTDPPERPGSNASSVAETVGRATTKVRDFVASDSRNPPAEPDPDAEWPGDWNSDRSSPDLDSSPQSRSFADQSRNPPTSDGNDDSKPSPSSGNDLSTDTDDDIIDADARRRTRENDGYNEDVAQASARTDVVYPDELDERVEGPDGTDKAASGHTTEPAPESDPDTENEPTTAPDGTIVSEPTGEEPDLADLREQLNDQFESIKVLEPGQYELNLMELYDREEYIIALQENGRYVIQVPEQWMGDPDER